MHTWQDVLNLALSDPAAYDVVERFGNTSKEAALIELVVAQAQQIDALRRELLQAKREITSVGEWL